MLFLRDITMRKKKDQTDFYKIAALFEEDEVLGIVRLLGRGEARRKLVLSNFPNARGEVKKLLKKMIKVRLLRRSRRFLKRYYYIDGYGIREAAALIKSARAVKPETEKFVLNFVLQQGF